MAEQSFNMKDMLRSKNFLIAFLFIVATSISIWLLSLPTPNLRTIVTKTHQQIESQIENLKNINIENLKNMNVMNRDEQVYEDRDLTLDETYLELLGFTDNPHLYPDPSSVVQPIPVIVSGATNKNYRRTVKLIDSVKKYMEGKDLVVFDLGMGSYELVYLKKHCNVTCNCTVRSLDFDKFPKHLKSKSIRAYLPILIQTALIDYAAIIWVSSDTEHFFVTADLSPVMRVANTTGIVAWTIDSRDPTSAYTHPKMFDYFKARQDDYLFHRMVSTDHLVILNTPHIHERLMLPWVQCALTLQCICPKGAQHVGCDHQRKPRYLYTGCHRYETSALNVILGAMFELVDDLYITSAPMFGQERNRPSTTVSSDVLGKSTKGKI